jgi:hypothetical protein
LSLGKIASAPSANIFTNREYEMLVRSLNLRRLSLVILAGGPNKFLTQLPSIQEKLVDVLKSSAAPIVQSEVIGYDLDQVNPFKDFFLGVSLYAGTVVSSFSS